MESYEVNDVNSAGDKEDFHDGVVVAGREILEQVHVSGAKDDEKQLLETVRKAHAVLLVPHSLDQNDKGKQVEHVRNDSEQVHPKRTQKYVFNS